MTTATVELDFSGRTTASVPIGLIDSFDRNPRESIGDITELADTIRAYGVIVPLTLARNGTRYTVLSGHRRLAAARVAGLDAVPAIVRAGDPAEHVVVAVIANTHHVALNPIEEGTAYRALKAEHGWTQYELAAAVGRSQPHVSKRMLLLDLPADVRGRIAAGELNPDAALYGAKIKKHADQAIRDTPIVDRGRDHDVLLPPVDQVRASALISRLATRGKGKGLQLSDDECEALIAIIKRAAVALRGDVPPT